MKITSTGVPALPAAPAPQDAAAAPVVGAAASAIATDGAERQTAGLQAAQAALRDMPEIDEAKVATLREALARGEIRFDAAKLAGLISRYHGGRE